MKKLLNIAIISLSLFSINASQSEVIPNASYVLFDRNDDLIHNFHSSNASFYSFDGDLLYQKPVFADETRYILKKRLDPNAPKPLPTTCKIIYWPAKRIGVPGDFISYIDKNGNMIASGRYNPNKSIYEQILQSHNASSCYEVISKDLLDLSMITECEKPEPRPE